jgi:hypothetical protein
MVERDTDQPRRLKIRHLFVALLLLLVVWLVFYRVTAHRDLARRMRELRDQGYPMSLEELDGWYALPEGAENAADYYLAAFSRYVEWDSEAREGLPWVGKGDTPGRTESLDASVRERVGQLLAENEEALSLLHEAVGFEHCRYPVYLTEGPNLTIDWLPSIRQSAFLLCLEGLLACERGDPNQAMESIRATLALAGSADAPVLIVRLVRIAVEALAYRRVEYVVNRIPMEDEQLRTLSAWIETYHDDEGYRGALIGERCFGLEMFRYPAGSVSAQGGPGGKVINVLVGLRRLVGLHDRDMLSYIDLIQGQIAALELPNHEWFAVHDSVDGAVADVSKAGLMTKMLMPALSRVFQLDSRSVAHRRAALTALGIERYRLAEGRLPGRLSDLVPAYLAAVPRDPFDGEDLRYDRLGAGYVVYSVGEDLSDDGGAEKSARQRGGRGEARWDVTFIVER